MTHKNSIFIATMVLASFAACNDQKKKEQQTLEEAEHKIELEMAAETAKKKADSLLKMQKDSIRLDSLRQVKEHGHAH